MRFLLIVFLFISCSQNKLLKPSDTSLKEEDLNWEMLYARELSNALKNQDDLAFYFFWPYYLEARYENKLKNLKKQRNP